MNKPSKGWMSIAVYLGLVEHITTGPNWNDVGLAGFGLLDVVHMYLLSITTK